MMLIYSLKDLTIVLAHGIVYKHSMWKEEVLASHPMAQVMGTRYRLLPVHVQAGFFTRFFMTYRRCHYN